MEVENCLRCQMLSHLRTGPVSAARRRERTSLEQMLGAPRAKTHVRRQESGHCNAVQRRHQSESEARIQRGWEAKNEFHSKSLVLIIGALQSRQPAAQSRARRRAHWCALGTTHPDRAAPTFHPGTRHRPDDSCRLRPRVVTTYRLPFLCVHPPSLAHRSHTEV